MTQGYENYAPNSSLSADRKSIAIRLQDGGSGDLDGVANGIIVGMGAHGSIRSISSNLDGSGSGGGGGGRRRMFYQFTEIILIETILNKSFSPPR
jgi:hypothetical protein